jgi:hypothetical protein
VEKERTPRTAKPTEKVNDSTVESDWYGDVAPELPRVTLERFGTVPAPRTLGEYVQTVTAIATKLSKVVAWRGQVDVSWGVHSGAARRVMQQRWIEPRPDYIGGVLRRAGMDDSEFEELDEIWRKAEQPAAVKRQLRDYEASLLDQARAAGHDNEPNGHRLGDFELFGLLQHHGAATPLVDVSRNAMIGLWFAAETLPETTGLVMAVADAGVVPAQSTIESANWHEVRDRLPQGKALWWVPRRISSRMAAQEAAFVTTPFWDQPWGSLDLPGTIMWKSESSPGDQPSVAFIAIAPELKAALHEAGRLGVTAYDGTTIYPDLPGFARYNGAGMDITMPRVR